MDQLQKPAFLDHRYAGPVTSRIAGFLAHIGLKTAPAALPQDTFLSGLTITTQVVIRERR